MSYCTPAQLVDGPGAAQELSELMRIEQALLVATIAATSRAAWSAEEIADADAALASVNRFLALADAEVNSRLAVRGYALPADASAFPILTVWARAIARYHFNRLREQTTEITGRVERDYKDALRALDLVAAGKLSLGAGDVLVPPAPASYGPENCTPARVFDSSSLADF